MNTFARDRPLFTRLSTLAGEEVFGEKSGGLRARSIFISALFVLAACFVSAAYAAEVLPPTPQNHFNDYAGVVKAGTAQSLNNELADFERTTSNQLLVVIFPHLQSDSSIEDYTTRVFQSWGVGRKGTNNGAVLFVFSQDHKLRIQTGYGLEGALPDILCKQIIENEITPRLRAGDFDGGMTNGVHAMMAAARGEYKGTDRTVRDSDDSQRPGAGLGIFCFVILLVLISALRASARRRGAYYSGTGQSGMWLGGGWGGGSSGGGGGGGGSFSGGGGSTGGGGASGSW